LVFNFYLKIILIVLLLLLSFMGVCKNHEDV